MLTKNGRFQPRTAASRKRGARSSKNALRAQKPSDAAPPNIEAEMLCPSETHCSNDAIAFPPPAPTALPRPIPKPAPAVALEQLSYPGHIRWIDRRRVPRHAYRLRAALQPVDATGALRSPVIYLRDLDQFGAGFIAHHDVSAMGAARLLLAAGVIGNRRPITVQCNIRRCRELPNRWFEGLLEFLTPQQNLARASQ